MSERGHVLSSRAAGTYVDVKRAWDNAGRDMEILRELIDRGGTISRLEASLLATMVNLSVLQQELLKLVITLAAEESK
jgi:1,4-dihydroxy-2-naphthoate octaprenyltransferase